MAFLDRSIKVVLYPIIIIGLAVSVVMVVDLWNPKRLGKYAYNTIIDDLNPDQLIEGTVEGPIEGGQVKNMEGFPPRFKNLSYSKFKQSYIENSNKTVIHQGDSLLFWNPETQLFFRYNVEFVEEKIGYPFNEYAWINPISHEYVVYGWVIIEHKPY